VAAVPVSAAALAVQPAEALAAAERPAARAVAAARAESAVAAAAGWVARASRLRAVATLCAPVPPAAVSGFARQAVC
jgi:hypothetical protein